MNLGTLGRSGEVAQPRAAGRTQDSRDRFSSSPERMEPLERPCWDTLGYKAGGGVRQSGSLSFPRFVPVVTNGLKQGMSLRVKTLE